MKQLPMVTAVLGALLALYLATKGVAAATWWFVTDVMGRSVAPLGMQRVVPFTISFILFFTPLLYLGCCVLARRWLRPDVPTLVLYMGTTFFCAVIAEVGSDALFVAVRGEPCWLYHIWPVHHGYTSGVGILMWPLYGFFVYFLHRAIHENPALSFLDNHPARAILIGVDAMILEVAANAFSLIAFGSFYFYYLPDDLSHFTTVEIFLPYVAAGWVGLRVLGWLEHRVPKVITGVVLQAAATLIVLSI